MFAAHRGKRVCKGVKTIGLAQLPCEAFTLVSNPASFALVLRVSLATDALTTLPFVSAKPLSKDHIGSPSVLPWGASEEVPGGLSAHLASRRRFGAACRAAFQPSKIVGTKQV